LAVTTELQRADLTGYCWVESWAVARADSKVEKSAGHLE